MMMSGEVLEEQRDIAREKKRVSQEQLRMALATIAEIQEQVKGWFNQILLAIETQNTNIEAIYLQVNEVKAQISTCEKCENKKVAEEIRKNVFFRLGVLITEHPKAVNVGLSIIGGLVLIILVFWLVPGAQGLTFDFSKWPAVAVGVMGR